MNNGWPNFIIPGAGKSGTSSVAAYLNQHPDIFISKNKEPTFFAYAEAPPIFNSPDKFHEQIICDQGQYNALFSNAEKFKAIGEASTYYLAIPDQTIENIKRLVPNSELIKIILILRNPIERAFSNYTMFVMNGWEDLSFRDAISDEVVNYRLTNGWSPSYDYLGEGMYSEKVRAYLDVFQDVHVCLYDDLQEDPIGLLTDIFTFLGVDNSFVPDISLQLNASGQIKSKLMQRILGTDNLIRKLAKSVLMLMTTEQQRATIKERLRNANIKRRRISPEDYAYLLNYYQADIDKLAALIHRDLSDWSKKQS